MHFLGRNLPLFLTIFLASQAHALPLDLDVQGLGTFQDGTPEAGAVTERWRLLTSEIAFAMSPRTMAPATTLGWSGFEISYDTSLVVFNTQRDYWSNVTQQQRGGGNIPQFPTGVAGLHIRKGLPFSFELEGHLSYLFNSSMLMMGVDLRYSILEGYKYVPNIAFRAGAGRLLNSGDIDMTTMNFDLTLSKTFAVAGVMTVTPVVGWGMLFMNANSGVLDATPENANDNTSVTRGGSLYTLPEQSLLNNYQQRISAGLRFQTWIFAFMYQFDGGFIRAAPFIHSHTFKLALDF